MVHMIGDPSEPDLTVFTAKKQKHCVYSNKDLRRIINPPDPVGPAGKTLLPGRTHLQKLFWFRFVGDAGCSSYEYVREGTPEEDKKLSEVSDFVHFERDEYGAYTIFTSWTRL